MPSQNERNMKMEAYVSWAVTEDDVYDADGEVVGIEEYALIEKVWVPAEQRGQGKGRELVEQAIKEIEVTGLSCKIAALPFDDGMEMADLVEWYESFGFSVEDASGDAVIMVM